MMMALTENSDMLGAMFASVGGAEMLLLLLVWIMDFKW
jgi:hypothetical protein